MQADDRCLSDIHGEKNVIAFYFNVPLASALMTCTYLLSSSQKITHLRFLEYKLYAERSQIGIIDV